MDKIKRSINNIKYKVNKFQSEGDNKGILSLKEKYDSLIALKDDMMGKIKTKKIEYNEKVEEIFVFIDKYNKLLTKNTSHDNKV